GSRVDFTFSEAPVGFVLGDIAATNGTMSALVMDDPTHWHATFTADDGFEGVGSVTVDAAKFTDAALNANPAATPDTVTIDTTADVNGDLELSFPDTSINAAERTAVSFSTPGIDPDIATATVTFTDSIGTTVIVAASSVVADFSSFV